MHIAGAQIKSVSLPLWRRDGSIAARTLVNVDVAEWARDYHWCSISKDHAQYAVRYELKKGIYLARELLGLQHGDRRQADHRNGNTLDNRRSNLRITTNAQNAQNRNGAYQTSRSGIRGVHWHKPSGKWRAMAAPNGKTRHIGLFATLQEAEAAAIAFRREHMPFSEMDQDAQPHLTQ